MSDVFIVTLDDAALQARLAEAVAKLRQPRELMDRIGAKLERNINDRFINKTDPNGQPWAPLRPSTIKRYLKKYDGNIPGSLLQRTRHMRDSLTHNAGDDFMEVGFGDRIAAFHETGTVKMTDRGLLTANPFTAELGAQDRDDVLDEIARYLAELL